MSQDDWQVRFFKITVNDMQIGAADAAGMDSNQQFSHGGRRSGQLDQFQWLTLPSENHGAHLVNPLFDSSCQLSQKKIAILGSDLE
jgi:hypothetical protein